MAAELDHEEVLEMLGLDKTMKDMVVLGAIIRAQKGPTDFIDFQKLREQLTKDEGGKKGKDPLIYRSLSRLEKEGFLEIDRNGHKHGYNSRISNIEKALQKTIIRNINELEKKLQEVDEEISKFQRIGERITSITSELIGLSIGKRKKEKAVFVQGLENIIRTLDDRILKGLDKGDVVRVTVDWLASQDYINKRRLRIMERIFKKGVEARALDHDRSEPKIRKSLEKTLLKWQGKKYNINYRVYPRQEGTYQFIARNDDGILLVVSEIPLSATWMPRDSNPELIDSAISIFDKDYDAGIEFPKFED
ncbi:MAG: hypothetical protein ACFFCP_09650 [Promethearchaeota archaeon]